MPSIYWISPLAPVCQSHSGVQPSADIRLSTMGALPDSAFVVWGGVTFGWDLRLAPSLRIPVLNTSWGPKAPKQPRLPHIPAQPWCQRQGQQTASQGQAEPVWPLPQPGAGVLQAEAEAGDVKSESGHRHNDCRAGGKKHPTGWSFFQLNPN